MRAPRWFGRGRAVACLASVAGASLGCAMPADGAGDRPSLVDAAVPPAGPIARDGGAPRPDARASDGGSVANGPQDPPDAEAPTRLPAACAGAVRWAVPGVARVHGVGPSEAWVITGDGFEAGALLHLRPDGTTVAPGLLGLWDVWGCGDEVWVVGNEGQVHRKRGAAAFERIDTGSAATMYGGFGCGSELWIPLGSEVLVMTGDTARRLPAGEDRLGKPVTAAIARGAGAARFIAEFYGHVLRWDRASGRFEPAGGTDDIISDVVGLRDGGGLSLHHGYALALDGAEGALAAVAPDLVASRAHRRSDRDIWFVHRRRLAHWDGERLMSRELSAPFVDVHADADSVWLAGVGGVASLSAEGACDRTIR